MNDYQSNLQQELEYLEQTLSLLRSELVRVTGLQSDRKGKLIASRKNMWEDTVHFSRDFDRLIQINQYLAEVSTQVASYKNTSKLIAKYGKMLESPYFGRFDFTEDGSDDREKIYIGLHNVMDTDTLNILVYDWRAPISSIFYRYELGKAAYQSPSGTISGSVPLKRQYKIKNSELTYFFDCSIRISDEILQEVLSRNSSARMRNIVETIQKEQDIVIRDADSELLIVQGAAGSGKTSIALHRIAFLLYQGLSSGIESKNIMIVSPNAVFSKYISHVLPELGEDNTGQIVFEDYAVGLLNRKESMETKNSQLEFLISPGNIPAIDLKKQSIGFKGSRLFAVMLDRLTAYCERHMIDFEDIYFDGKIIETRQKLRTVFLDNKIGMSVAKRLKRIEKMIMDRILPLQRERIGKIEKFIQKMGGHEFEIKQFSRLLSLKQSRVFTNRLKKFTEVDYYRLYRLLFEKEGLFSRLASGLALPDNISHIIMSTRNDLANGHICHEDCAPLLYLKLRLEDPGLFPEVRYAVIDEAQDYTPVQYEVFKLLFRDAYYTVLGDINQAIDMNVNDSLYDTVIDIFNRRKSVKILLGTSYRSSCEIFAFTQKLSGKKQETTPFERHETEPLILSMETIEEMDRAIVEDIKLYSGQGYESIAVVCKTAPEAEKLHGRLKNLIDKPESSSTTAQKDSIDIHPINIQLIRYDNDEVEKGAAVMPVYMAKGLEFDVVIVYDVSRDNYSSETDRRLLYIACTRALHRLVLRHTGSRSPFINSI